MSFPNIPNITPTISVTTAQTIPLLLSSIALEELALAHIINAEAEKLQFVLGTLPPGRTTLSPPVVTISNLLAVDSSVQRTLRDVIKKEMLLEFKFENVLDLLATTAPIITLNADPTTICTSGTGPNTSTLTGQVLVGGSPPPAGTPVSFTVDNPALGTVAPNPAVTDAFGNFTATFTAIDGPGTVMITATALGGNSDPITTTIIDNCNVLSELSLNIASNICSSGTGPNTTTVSGQVLVDGGVAVAGIPVEFSVDNPLLASISPTNTTTDASGNFTATLTAIDGPGTVGVTTTLPTIGGFSITLSATIADCSVFGGATLGVDEVNICSSGTGPNTTTVSGQLFVDGGVAVAGIPVEFSVDDPLRGSVSPVNTTTDASGNFTTTLTAIDGTGTVGVTASFPTFGSSLTVGPNIVDCSIFGGASLSIAEDVCSSGTGPNTTTVSGQLFVGGGLGFAVAGIPVEFSVDNPLLASVSPATTTTDALGNFSTTFTAIDGPGTVDVTATFPTVGGGSLTVTTHIVDCL
ncbi:hypothetical protein ACIGHG_09945 [Bacillus sp. NPDC077411]|uniref:Big-1 domain-containing protein n=1 Tax=Bacillus bruguierae TaxID=3127667 RepID=A0ABU8FCX2_9BACI